jgi:hypothetical protein
VELLVFICIIAVLIGILRPALSRSREQALRIKCMSNIRQLTMAWLTYANDNRGHFCSSETQANTPGLKVVNHWAMWTGTTGVNAFHLAGYPDPQPEIFWSWMAAGVMDFSAENGRLWPYVKNHETYRCPDDQGWHQTSYQPNGMFAGETGLPKTWLTLGQARHPASTFLFIEAWDSRGWLLNSFKPPLYPMKVFGSAPGQNHSGYGDSGCTVSFLDGHAIYWNYADHRTSTFASSGTVYNTFSLTTQYISPTVPENQGDQYIYQGGIVNGPYGSPDVFQLEAWSGGSFPAGVTP